jgi:hypothetical protein
MAASLRPIRVRNEPAKIVYVIWREAVFVIALGLFVLPLYAPGETHEQSRYQDEAIEIFRFSLERSKSEMLKLLNDR